jgi:hypothetical protein
MELASASNSPICDRPPADARNPPDHPAGAESGGAQRVAGRRGDETLPLLGDRVYAAHQDIRAGTQAADLGLLGGAIERPDQRAPPSGRWRVSQLTLP